MRKVNLLSLFRRNIEGRTIRIERSNPGYSYVKREYREYCTEDNEGLIVSIEEQRARLVRERVFLERLIRRSDDAYLFFKDEYRQNSMMEDHFGNVLLSDDAVGIKR